MRSVSRGLLTLVCASVGGYLGWRLARTVAGLIGVGGPARPADDGPDDAAEVAAPLGSPASTPVRTPVVAAPPEREGSAGFVERVRGFYGEHPLHLLVLVVSFALTGYVVTFVIAAPDTVRIGVWFLGAVVAHDLILFPLYALADRSATAALRWRDRRWTSFAVPGINYLRLPVMASGLLFLVFFPAILQQGEATYHRASGLSEGTTYLGRWLLITAFLFLASALAYAVRVSRSPSQRRDPQSG